MFFARCSKRQTPRNIQRLHNSDSAASAPLVLSPVSNGAIRRPPLTLVGFSADIAQTALSHGRAVCPTALAANHYAAMDVRSSRAPACHAAADWRESRVAESLRCRAMAEAALLPRCFAAACCCHAHHARRRLPRHGVSKRRRRRSIWRAEGGLCIYARASRLASSRLHPSPLAEVRGHATSLFSLLFLFLSDPRAKSVVGVARPEGSRCDSACRRFSPDRVVANTPYWFTSAESERNDSVHSR